eukprot:UN05581
MPGYSSNGQANPGKAGNYYCDANDGNSEWCWEMDVMEANKYVTQVTPHSCDQNPGGYISACDRGGCATNSYRINSGGMCASSNCKINTNAPFRYSVRFGSTMHVKLTQGSNSFEFDACSNGGYVSNMDRALDYGMTLVMSYWGSTYSGMSWLDGMTGCQGDCDGKGLAVFSDIEI